jgi:mannose/fructose/N-acetylgalactosamine-specific phosphotransferase system component IIC
MRSIVNVPMFWCWLFTVIWLGFVVATYLLMNLAGLTISLLGLFAALLMVIPFHHRRRKNEFHG